MNGTSARLGMVENAMLRRAAGLWLLVRIAVAPFLAAAEQHPIYVASEAALFIIGCTAALCWIVARRRFEDLLLGNMGTAPWSVVALCVAPPLVLELVVALAGRT